MVMTTLTAGQRQAAEQRRPRPPRPPAADRPPGASRFRLTGLEDPNTRRLLQASRALVDAGVPSLKPALPLLLNLKGKPYTLDRYFPFAPFFRTRVPRTSLLKTGRQVSKSTSLAAQGIAQSISTPYLSTLYVTPLYEMIRRFSHNYVRQFIDTSPLRHLFAGPKTAGNVLQRGFPNGASMYFSFAFLDAERTRGIPADKNVIDEVQDMNWDFLDIIHETLSGSEAWGTVQYAGTPKSLDNTMERLWQESSQAEWIIKCQRGGCGHWNVPAFTHDLLDMIGKYRDDISEDSPGVVCAKCGHPVDPRRHGRWVHAREGLRWDFAGYHVPQIIMPMHYGNPAKWSLLLNKMAGGGNTTQTVFLNEVCGESSDAGSKMVTVSDLKAAANLGHKNRAEDAERLIRKYTLRVLAVDWGGGGGRLAATSRKRGGEEQRMRTSFTTMALLGLRADGQVHCLWAHRSLRTHDHLYEARLVGTALNRFKCHRLVHDYSNAGSVRETILVQGGWPVGKIFPVAYHGAQADFIKWNAPEEGDQRDWWSLNRSWSLGLTCEAIKAQVLRFYDYDFVSAAQPGLLHDFLALIEEKVDSRLGTDTYAIVRNPNASDDFAHAVNIGCAALWRMSKKWPDLTRANRFRVPGSVIQHLHPLTPAEWLAL